VISAFSGRNAEPSFERLEARDALALARPAPRRERSPAGFEPASTGAKYPKSSPPALSSRSFAARLPGEQLTLDGRKAFDNSEVSKLVTTRNLRPPKGRREKRKTICRDALNNGAPPKRALRRSPCHRYPAFASFPPNRPRAFGRAPLQREPLGSGSPVRLSPGNSRISGVKTNKKPSGAAGSGGSVATD
jgi:hypothetical protein